MLSRSAAVHMGSSSCRYRYSSRCHGSNRVKHLPCSASMEQQQQQLKQKQELLQQGSGSMQQPDMALAAQQTHKAASKNNCELQQHVCTHQTQVQSTKQQQQRQQQDDGITDAAVHKALQTCTSWPALTNYLLQELQLANHRHQQQMSSTAITEHGNSSSCSSASINCRRVQHKLLLWQRLNGHQAQLVVQHATQLAAAKQRLCAQVAAGGPAAIPPDSLSGGLVPPSRLQQPLALLLRRAMLRAAAAPGNAVVAAGLLRAVWRLGVLTQQQQHELGQQLLDIMCAGHSADDRSLAGSHVGQDAPRQRTTAAAAAAAAMRQHKFRLSNANLLADVAQSVVRLQLHPSDDWLAWFNDTVLAILQQLQGQGSPSRPNTAQQSTAGKQGQPSATRHLLISTLRLACFMQRTRQQFQGQQQQQVVFPDDSWLQSWVAAAACLDHPFSNAQLLQVLSAGQQLQLKLPSSVWQLHLSAAAVREMPAQQLLQLLVQLPSLLQHQLRGDSQRRQQQQLFTGDWRTTAAHALLSHASAAASTDPSLLQMLPEAVIAACQLQLPLQPGDVHRLLLVLLQDSRVGASSGSDSNHGTKACEADPKAAASSSSSSNSGSVLHQAPARVAAATVFALAQMSIAHPPPAPYLTQLQVQLLPKLQQCSMEAMVDLLWVFAVKWRVQPSEPWLAAFIAATESLLESSSPKHLRMLLVGVSLLDVTVPEGWMQQYLQATAAVLGRLDGDSSSSSSSSAASSTHAHGNSQQQQQLVSTPGPEFAAFLSSVAYSLVQLKFTPPPAWQCAWHSAAAQQATYMTPNQLVDTLYAAAAWSDAEQQCMKTTASMVPATVASGPGMPPPAAVTSGSIAAGTAGSSVPASAAGAVQCSAGAAQLLPKPQRKWPLVISSSSSSSCASPLHASRPASTVGQQPQEQQQQARPSDVWVRGLLQRLRQVLPQCTPAQITTALWCLRPLQYKASVVWLDAVYDSLLGQLHQCNMLQLQQLLRSLLHQQHILAPARIDAVLDAGLVLLLQGRTHCSEQQLVWLLQLVARLHHEPEPEWTAQAAAAAERMLCYSSGSSSSSSLGNQQQGHVISRGSSVCRCGAGATAAEQATAGTSGWSPGLLTDLLDGLSQLGAQELPSTWASSFRKAAWQHLSHFTGQQLARLLSAAALLHWEVPRPFLQLLLKQLRQRMHSMDVHALGLVGVAIGQMGLVMGRRWSRQYLARVQQLVRHRPVGIPVSDVGNLQRSIQYLQWCSGKARGITARSLQCSGSSRRARRLTSAKTVRHCKLCHTQLLH